MESFQTVPLSVNIQTIYGWNKYSIVCIIVATRKSCTFVRRVLALWHVCRESNLRTPSGKFLRMKFCRPESFDFSCLWLPQRCFSPFWLDLLVQMKIPPYAKKSISNIYLTSFYDSSTQCNGCHPKEKSSQVSTLYSRTLPPERRVVENSSEELRAILINPAS